MTIAAVKFVADRIKLIGAIFGVIGSVATAVLYIDHNYAHAADIQTIIQNQTKQIDLYGKQERENQIFKLEYYQDKLKSLELEKRKSEAILSNPKTSPTLKALTRTPEEIQSEIDDIKQRSEIVKKSIVGN